MSNKGTTPKSARNEAEIFDDLRELCCSTGYIHAIAYFCWRDNLIQFAGDQITCGDIQHQHSHERLLTSEISTLIGLMAKGDINMSIPPPKTFQYYVKRSEELLHEMHISLQKPWLAAFEAMAGNSSKASKLDPFGTADGLREPIFYSGESAYNFQYEELSPRKYRADDDWLRSHAGFSIDEACVVVRCIGSLQIRNLLNLREEMLKIHPDYWTFLPGFVFSVQDLAGQTGISSKKIERVLMAFTVDQTRANASFSSLSAFNETNANPIIKAADGSYILLQHYSLLEALYEAPFFWMASDSLMLQQRPKTAVPSPSSS